MSDYESFLYRGNQLHLAGRLSEAIDEYRTAVGANPDGYHGWLDLGVALSEVSDRAGATEALRSFLRCCPQDAEWAVWRKFAQEYACGGDPVPGGDALPTEEITAPAEGTGVGDGHPAKG